jgi:hypothetical protein
MNSPLAQNDALSVVTTGVSPRGTVFGTFTAMGSPLDHEADKSAIEALVAKFNDAWNRHDAHALAALFAEDADFTNVRGEHAGGRKAIEDMHAPPGRNYHAGRGAIARCALAQRRCDQADSRRGLPLRESGSSSGVSRITGEPTKAVFQVRSCDQLSPPIQAHERARTPMRCLPTPAAKAPIRPHICASAEANRGTAVCEPERHWLYRWAVWSDGS